MALGWIGMGRLGIVYSQATSIPFAILLVGISGFMNAPPAIAGRLIIQRNTPREMRGRVNSAFFVWPEMSCSSWVWLPLPWLTIWMSASCISSVQ